jgi:hypothetical protein
MRTRSSSDQGSPVSDKVGMTDWPIPKPSRIYRCRNRAEAHVAGANELTELCCVKEPRSLRAYKLVRSGVITQPELLARVPMKPEPEPPWVMS